jgi:hypothetical protein
MWRRICTLASVLRSPGRLRSHTFAAFVLALLLVAAVAGVVIAVEMALFAAPFLVIAALLLSERFVGEERILATRRTVPPRRRRRIAHRWPTHPETPFSVALERAPWSLRGPPLARAAA